MNGSKRIISSILLWLLLSGISLAQDWNWGYKAAGNNQHTQDADIAVSNDGSVVITGYFQGSLNFDTFSIRTTDDYYSDIFLCRMNSDHKVYWLKKIEAGQSYDHGIGVTTDGDKNIYLTGSRSGQIFVSKFDSTGSELWYNNFNETYYGYGRDIAVDQYDNAYITGENGGSTLIAKLDFNGKTVWTKRILSGSSNGCLGNDIAVTALGTVYIAGVFENDGLFLDSTILHYSYNWNSQPFVAKISPSAKVDWVITPVGLTSSNPQLALASDGFYLSSDVNSMKIDFGGIILYNQASGNYSSPFLSRYDTNGIVKWARLIHSYYDNQGRPMDIATDLDDNVYLVGQVFTCYGSFCTELDFYTEKYSPSGINLWTTAYQSGSSDYVNGISIDTSGHAFVLGSSHSGTFINEETYSSTQSYGVGKLNTNSSTRLLPSRPQIERVRIVCPENKVDSLSATGTDIRWYSDPFLKNLVRKGNTLDVSMINRTDTFYVTQTINKMESWPKQTILRFSELGNILFTLRGDTLWATKDDYCKYQWFYNGDSLKLATKNYYLPDTFGLFSVEISDGPCSKQLDTMYISNSIIEKMAEKNILIYPNPASAGVTVIIKLSKPDNILVQLLDFTGKELYSMIKKTDYLYEVERIDLSSYSSGIYFIKITGDTSENTYKIMKK